MPIKFARRLAGRKRSPDANRQLGFMLTFVAGAVNAGGFLAVSQYTSHMTGIVSGMADNVALGQYDLVLAGLGALTSFVNGAICCAVMVNFSRRRGMHSQFALPLLLEAALLLCFGFLGPRLADMHGIFIPFTVGLLCFLMGLQNAVITKISKAEIRTTHITGIVTDIGIELGKLLYWNSPSHAKGHDRVVANRTRLKLLGTLAGCFFVGGVVGAVGFSRVGYVTTVPLALVLVWLAGVPALDDVSLALRRARR